MVHPIVPDKCELFLCYLLNITYIYLVTYVDIYLEDRKHAQTGDPHCYRVHANDKRPEICPIRALIKLSQVYGQEFDPCGSLFLNINQKGIIEVGCPLVREVLYLFSSLIS